jgi:hypothetical protein
MSPRFFANAIRWVPATKKPVAAAYGLLGLMRSRVNHSAQWTIVLALVILDAWIQYNTGPQSIESLEQLPCPSIHLCKPRSSGSSVEVLITLVGIPLALRQK